MSPLDLDIFADNGNRLVFSAFCLLIAVLLLYFWGLTRGKEGAGPKQTEGLVFLALAYLLHFAIGVASVLDTPRDNLLMLSGLINLAFLLSLPFFSLRNPWLDRLIEHDYWRNAWVLLGFSWLLAIAFAGARGFFYQIDKAMTALALVLLGMYLARYFYRRGLRFVALVTVIYFLTYIALPLFPPDSLAEGKFEHLSSLLLGPSLPLAVIGLAFTFNWLNELNFYELSHIWVQRPEDGPQAEQKAYAQLARGGQRDTWLDRIAKDDIESVIDEIIINKKHKHENLETILNIAARNTRNNNDRVKDLISYEEYQRNRNKAAQALITVIRQ